MFGLWIEQLIAESTGKEGTGILPSSASPSATPTSTATTGCSWASASPPALDALADAGHPVPMLPFDGEFAELGGQVLLWELATALAGALLGIQPFDQPDVAAAKAATAEVLAAGPPDCPRPLDDLLAQVQPGDYLAIQAFVDPGSPGGRAHRGRPGRAARPAAGGDHRRPRAPLPALDRPAPQGRPANGVFVQVVADTATDVAIPGQPTASAR